jgi:hypothetical protein
MHPRELPGVQGLGLGGCTGKCGRIPCERCNGTGNQLYGMFQTCDDCRGSGHARNCLDGAGTTAHAFQFPAMTAESYARFAMPAVTTSPASENESPHGYGKWQSSDTSCSLIACDPRPTPLSAANT